jgi:L-alanine-DL-glutamate epimerase-like enolase superfamily enzyme
MKWRIESLDLHTRHPFIIARGGGSVFGNFVLCLEWQGLTACGEGAPSAYYGETRAISEAALAFLGEALPERELEGLDADRIADILAQADRLLAGHPAAKAALDGALWDLAGRQRGEPVWRLLGLAAPAPLATSFTIAIAPAEEMLARAQAAAAAGFSVLKLKAGGAEDLAIIERIAEATGCRLRVDANGAWSAREALDKMERLAMAGVEFVEQPLAGPDLAGYRAIAGRAPLPIILDESVRNLLDLEVFGEYADGVNLKISKCGGISRCLEIALRARAAGLDLMMGCMIESSLGIAQGAQLLGLLRWADLDGFLLIAEDPFEGLTCEAGLLRPPAGSGLGVRRRG